MLGLALILAFLQTAPIDVKEELRRDRLVLLAEYADARADRVRIEKTIEALKAARFDAADDETLRRLTVQLTESERRAAELQTKYGPGSKAAELVEAVGLRDGLNQKVKAARESLPRFYEAELSEAKEREAGLRSAIAELQKRIEPAEVVLDPRVPKLEEQLRDAQEQLAKAQQESLQQKLDPRIPKLETQLQDAQEQLAKAQKESLQPKVDPRIPKLEAQLQDAQEQLAKAQKESLQPKVDPRIPKLEAQLQDAQGQLAEARQESLQPKADPRIPQLEAQLRDAQDQLANARNESLQPRVAELQKTVDALRSAINSTKPTPPPKPGEVRLNQTDQSLYAFIPAGAFQMGCVASDPHCRDDEKPAHLVTLTHGFWMSSTEVTVKAYRLFATAAGGALPKENTSTNPGWRESGQPMSFMQWDTAQSFCEWAGGRLPTEAEWEYAARGGKDGSVYPWGEAPDRNHANWMGKGGLDKYTEVADAGTFLQNPWNLYDIIGNLGEWVADYYGPYDAAPSTDPKGPDAGKQRVIRGGSWAANEREIRTSVRKAWLPTEYSNNVGFRCVLDKLP